MAQADRMHGVTTKELTEGVRSISNISTNVIGIVCTGADADAQAFPLDTPVYFTSSFDALTKAGDKGTLAKSLDGICDQADAPVVIVRVSEDEDPAKQKGHVIGKATGGKATGLQALRRAKAYVGLTPKILGVPELDDKDVTAELVGIAQELNAFAYASAGGDAEITKVATYRKGFGQRELMLIDNDFVAFDPVTLTSFKAATIARVLGLRSKIDNEIGWHKSISNAVVNGVSGLDLPRTFELVSVGTANTDANFLNNADVTTLIRENGFRVWGNRTCSADPMFAFEVAVRSAQIVKETIASSFLWAMDKPMHPSLLKDIAAGINSKLAEYVYQGRLLGAQVSIDRQANTKERVGNGIFQFDYEMTPVPPLENIHLVQRITDKFIVDLVNKTVSLASEFAPVTV